MRATATANLIDCGECNAFISHAEFDDHDGYCKACYDETWFRCSDCNDSIERSEAHAAHDHLCESCGEAKVEEEREAALEAVKAELDELIEAVKDTDDLAVITKAIVALKRAKK